MSLVCLAVPARAQQGGGAAPDIRALEDTLAQGLVRKDRAALESLIAPGFVMRGDPDIDRHTWLGNAMAFCWGDRAEIADFAVQDLGDAVIATFILTTDRDPTTCAPAVVRSLITDVWRRDDGWRLTLRQSGPAGATLAGQFARTAPPPPRWEVRSELSLVATAGNTSTQTLGVGGNLEYRPGPWLTTMRVAFVRAGTDGQDNARSLAIEFRQSRDLSSRAGVFGHAAYLRDTFAGIEHRVGADGGLTYKVVTTAPHAMNLDAGVGYTRETRVAEADRSFATGTLALVYKWNVTRTASLTNDGTFTANLQDRADWRATDTAALSASLNSTLSLRLSYALKFLNRPVPGFKKTDSVVSAALVARFSR